MSQYVNFYIQSKNGEWIKLDAFSKNSIVYEYIQNHLSYEDGRVLTPEIFKETIDSINSDISVGKECIQNAEEKKDLIASMNNSVEEKLEAIHGVDNEIQEIRESLDDLLCGLSVIRTFYSITDRNDIYAGIEWNPNYSEEDEG